MSILKKGTDLLGDLVQNVSKEVNTLLGNEQNNNANGACLINIFDGNENMEVEVAAPGFSKEEIKINVSNNVLNISGTKLTTSTKQYTLQEFGAKPFLRQFQLNSDVEPELITALYREGILTIILPKKKAGKDIPIL